MKIYRSSEGTYINVVPFPSILSSGSEDGKTLSFSVNPFNPTEWMQNVAAASLLPIVILSVIADLSLGGSDAQQSEVWYVQKVREGVKAGHTLEQILADILLAVKDEDQILEVISLQMPRM